ncbi:hypothetical protein WJX72_004771 [[Myrmecia] bisecta]|uniref:Amine oxidase domain-containing protein n=1 Tax=[Myrmecia] bisecta TaxID=41462 RepID=A0AAW1PQ00_9CHLO
MGSRARVLISTRQLPIRGAKCYPRELYQGWLEEQSTAAQGVAQPVEFIKPADAKATLKKRGATEAPAYGNVAVVGAGMAGLQAAILLRERSNGNPLASTLTIFEANSRPGGRLFSHHFAADHNTYCEIGGMRLPSTHQLVWKLIDDLTKRNQKLPIIDYNMKTQRCFVGGCHGNTNDANELLKSVMNPILAELKAAAQKGQRELDTVFKALAEKYDEYSLYRYLREVAGWDLGTIEYVETMTDQTDAFQMSFIDKVIDAWEFEDDPINKTWHTIDGGMQQLPDACLSMLELDGVAIKFNSRVTKLDVGDKGKKGKILLTWTNRSGLSQCQAFDKVLLAVPPLVVRMMKTPRWSAQKELAIRALRYDPIRKIGLLFKSRWWEKLASDPVKGGQSTTDLPSRWVVYPSNDIGGEGKGALLCYSWTYDAYAHLTLTETEKVDLAMRDIKLLHGDKVKLRDGSIVTLDEQFLEGFPFEWSQSWAGGIATFFPGQWKYMYAAAQLPENNSEGEPAIFFAGEHLSKHHAWVEGALESAQQAVKQMTYDHFNAACLSKRTYAGKVIMLDDVLRD